MSLQPNPLYCFVCGMDMVIEDKGRVFKMAGKITDIKGKFFPEAVGLLMDVDHGNLGSMAPENGVWKEYPERSNEVQNDH